MADILLIDDDATSRALLRGLLTGLGHEVKCCTVATDAMQALTNRRYDVVVTDILMPDMDGLETIRAIAANHPGVPVVAISGGGMHGYDFLRVARTFGAAATLRKPVPRGELQDVIETVLGKANCSAA